MNDIARPVTSFIWSKSELLGFLGHPSIRVQEWSASHVLTLYPDAAEQAIQALPMASTYVAYALLEELMRLPIPEEWVDPLKRFLDRTDVTAHTRALAAAVLLRNGISLPDDILEELPIEQKLDELCGTQAGFDQLLHWYIAGREADGELLHAISKACNAEELFHTWDYGKEQRRFIKNLEKYLRTRLPAVHKVKSFEQALRLLSDSLSANAQSIGLVRSKFPVIAAQVDSDRARIAATLKAAEQRQAEGKPPLPAETELLLACALALHRDEACLKFLLAEPLKVNDVWSAVTLRSWSDQAIDSNLAAFMEVQNPQSLISSLREALKRDWAYFDHAFHYLEATKASERHTLLREALDHKFDDRVFDDTWDLLDQISRDSDAMDSLLEEWRQNPPSPFDAYILPNYPTEETARFLLDNFEGYISQPHSRLVIEAMEEIGSKHFIEPLVREWRSGEAVLSRVLRFLSELHDVKDDASVRAAVREANENRFLDRIEDPTQLDDILYERPVSIPLRCVACKRTYAYQIERIYMGRRLDDILVGQVVQCKGCGSLESYEITKETHNMLGIEMIRMTTLKSMDKDVESPFVAGPTKLSAAGRTFNSGPEAYSYLSTAIERDPDNAEFQRRMGNYLKNGSRTDLAMPYFREALRLNPKEGESLYGLAACLIAEGRHWEAIPLAEALIELAREELDADEARAAFIGLMELNMDIQEATGTQIGLFKLANKSDLKNKQGSSDAGRFELLNLDMNDPDDFEAAFHMFRYGSLPKDRLRRRSREPEPELFLPQPAEPVRVTKIGRNEPCSCGSGKKYKRCCGR